MSRVLLAGGFAGAAWFLSSSAAHAATAPDDTPPETAIVTLGPTLRPVTDAASRLVDQIFTPESTMVTPAVERPTATIDTAAGAGLSLVPSSSADTSGRTGMSGTRTTVARATTSRDPARPTASQADGSSRTDTVDRVGLAGRVNLAGTGDAGTGDAATEGVPMPSVDGTLSRVVRGLTAPLHLTGVVPGVLDALGPVTGALDPVLGPVVHIVRPVLPGLAGVLEPMTGESGGPVDRSAVVHSPDRRPGPATVAGGRLADDPSAGTHDRAGMSAGASLVDTVTMPGPLVGDQTPGDPEPPTTPVYPGSGSTGNSTTASGSHLDGGLAAVPASGAVVQVASHHLPLPGDVEVRRLIVETSTFSPD